MAALTGIPEDHRTRDAHGDPDWRRAVTLILAAQTRAELAPKLRPVNGSDCDGPAPWSVPAHFRASSGHFEVKKDATPGPRRCLLGASSTAPRCITCVFPAFRAQRRTDDDGGRPGHPRRPAPRAAPLRGGRRIPGARLRTAGMITTATTLTRRADVGSAGTTQAATCADAPGTGDHLMALSGVVNTDKPDVHRCGRPIGAPAGSVWSPAPRTYRL